MEVLNPCWCCGAECMFCTPEENACEGNEHGDIPSAHWCANCKYGGEPGHECYQEPLTAT